MIFILQDEDGNAIYSFWREYTPTAPRAFIWQGKIYVYLCVRYTPGKEPIANYLLAEAIPVYLPEH